MSDLMQLLGTVLRNADKAPELVRLAVTVRRAHAGDPAAVQELMTDGWRQAANLYAPGLGDMLQRAGQSAYQAYREWRQPDGDVIEGEWRDVTGRTPGPPWASFLRRVIGATYGGHVVFGPPGSGKTTLAFRLAQAIARAHGFAVECVNVYGDDVPSFATPIADTTLVNRMKRLQAYLRSQAADDDDDEAGFDVLSAAESIAGDLWTWDDAETATAVKKTGPKLPPINRVIVIDEASLTMTTSPSDPVRRATLQALAQCRHIGWVVIAIGQTMSQLPTQILGQTTVWVKHPSGREPLTDRDNPVVRDLWTRAIDAFEQLPRSVWWQADPAAQDKRKWAFVDCLSFNGGTGWSGMLPVRAPEDAE